MTKKIAWRCPSNIALVKYWGKKGNQIPCNASISMTLQNAYTDTSLILTDKKSVGIELEYFFEGKQNAAFQQRILQYLEQNKSSFPVLDQYAMRIESENSFPHSTGIASSASAFGALALVLLSASDYTGDDFLERASFLSRLGSGSASRSMYPGYALWGALDEVVGSSDEFAIPVTDIHPDFSDMRDSILIVDDEPKSVSSSVGHGLMKGHSYANVRFLDANRHTLEMKGILETGDLGGFVSLIEREALALHAMMMTSSDYYLLMKPDTVAIIDAIMSFRRETGVPVGFTLDAGPNVHVIYPGKVENEVNSFLKSLQIDLKGVINDKIGTGPIKLA